MFKCLALSLSVVMFLVASAGAQQDKKQNKTKTQDKSEQDAQQAKPKVGDQAPDWELVATDGKTYKLSNYKGKQGVVVAWYPAAMTGG